MEIYLYRNISEVPRIYSGDQCKFLIRIGNYLTWKRKVNAGTEDKVFEYSLFKLVYYCSLFCFREFMREGTFLSQIGKKLDHQ